MALDPRQQPLLSVATHPDPAQRPAHARLREEFRAAGFAPAAPHRRHLRLAAMGLFGVSLGVGGAVIGGSFVQASDRVDMYEVVKFDQKVREARRAQAPQAVFTSHAYAPAQRTNANPLGVVNSRGQISLPAFNLNPFQPLPPEAERLGRPEPRQARNTRAVNPDLGAPEGLDVISGASNAARTICVRVCDGYQHPIGHLRDNGDLPAHEALCRTMFPGVPTRVFRVAAGATGIDDAVGRDGKTYRQLPMAYAFQTSIDPACAKPRTGEATVAVMKDFTLRAGDTVMLNGRPRVFNGSTNYPFTTANFRDFRASSQLSESTRRQIDNVVGVSRQERLQREVRAMQRVREADATPRNVGVDVVRGGTRLEDAQGREIGGQQGPRVIEVYRR
jgi:hypothetical protein